jgi:mono/diheme cytochrome c family protein
MTPGRDSITQGKILVATGLILAAAGIGYVAFTGSSADEQSAAAFQGADMIALGRDVYVSQCAACHGANLEGQPDWRNRKPNGRLPAPPHDETGHTWHHDDETLFNLTKYGLAKIIGSPVETDMPAYEDVLTDTQIHAVIAYIKSQWPEHVRARQTEITERAARKAGS